VGGGRQGCLSLLVEEETLPFLMDLLRLDKTMREMYLLIVLQQCRHAASRRGVALPPNPPLDLSTPAVSAEAAGSAAVRPRQLYRYAVWPMGTPPPTRAGTHWRMRSD
jgi:hypothetical protein